MSDWRDNDFEERPAIAPSLLAAGDSMVVEFLNDGHQKDTRNGEATVFGLAIHEVPDDATDMGGDPVEEGEEYDLYTDSSRLLGQLADFADDLTGETAEIEAFNSASSYDRTYSVQKP